MTRTASPGCTEEERRAEIDTPAMRVKTRCSPGGPDGTGRAKRPASAFACEAWWAKVRTRSPAAQPRSGEPAAMTRPRLP